MALEHKFGVTTPPPPELTDLDPLLEALNLRWSHHYSPPEKPEANWCLVRGHKAARVGMTVAEAREEVIRLAAARIKRLMEITDQAKGRLEFAAQAIVNETQFYR